jgi:putative DNA primase/helicase
MPCAQSPAPGATGQEIRACQRLGLLAMAGELATRNGILPWPDGEATRAARTIFAAWLAARGGVGAAEDRAAVQQVAGFIATHGAGRFQPITGEAPTVINNRAGFWRADEQEGREYLIHPQTWTGEVCQGMNPTTVANLLARRGYLRPGTNGKNAQTVSRPGLGKARLCCFQPHLPGRYGLNPCPGCRSTFPFARIRGRSKSHICHMI